MRRSCKYNEECIAGSYGDGVYQIKAMDRKFHDEVECTVPEAKVDFQHMMRISAGASREGAREVLEELKAKATGIPHRPLLTLLSGFPNIPKTGVSLVSDGSSEEDDKG